MNINENIWIESLEIMGDAMDEVREEREEREVHEAIADEQELTDEIVDDWYASLIIEHENYEDHKDRL